MKCNRILKAIQFYHKIDVIEEKGKKILKSKTKKKMLYEYRNKFKNIIKPNNYNQHKLDIFLNIIL